MGNSYRIRMQVASRSRCDALLSRSLFSSSTFADVDLHQSPSCLTLSARGKAEGYLCWHRSITLQRGCVCFGEDRAARQNPHQVNHHHSVWRGSELLTLCVYACVCLMSDWLGRGLGSWEPLKPPLGEPPRTLHTFPDTLSLPQSAPTWPGLAGSGWLSAMSVPVLRGN